MSQYITLVSDANLDIFPTNRIGSFRSKLPQFVISDKDRFQIGVTYISWPNNVYNISESTITIKAIAPSRMTIIEPIDISENNDDDEADDDADDDNNNEVDDTNEVGDTNDDDDDDNNINEVDDIDDDDDVALIESDDDVTSDNDVTSRDFGEEADETSDYGGVTFVATSFPEIKQTVKKTIPSGYYKSIPDLLKIINEKIESSVFNDLPEINMSNGFAKFSYDKTTQKITFRQKEGSQCQISIKFNTELFTKLGFGINQDSDVKHHWVKPNFSDAGSIITAPLTADLNLGRSSIFLYSDIVTSDRIIGNRLSNLMAILPNQSGNDQVCHFSPLTPEYCNLAFDRFDEIQMDLVNELGQIVEFQSGKVIITLHIKDKMV